MHKFWRRSCSACVLPMIRAGIVLDTWKLAVFKKHLDKTGFKYEQSPGPVADTILLTVHAPDVATMQPICVAANNECARMK